MSKQLSEAAIEQLKRSTIDGNILRLPKGGFLKREVFLEIRNKLQAAGAKYVSGTGFQFTLPPEKILSALLEGNEQEVVIDLDLLVTPDMFADLLVSMAELKPGDTVCEPSAGDGSIMKAIQRAIPNMPIYWYEKHQALAAQVDETIPLSIFKGFNFLHDDLVMFSKFVACPPLTNHQDMKHVLMMYQKLAPKGRIVSVMGTDWQKSHYSNCINFREWLKKIKANIIPVPDNTYVAAGRNVPVCIVIINKP